MNNEITVFSKKRTCNIGGKLICFDEPKIMGILNITPDSFFDGGKYLQEKEALKQVSEMLSQGAEIIDIGAYSSKPQATPVAVKEEINRLIPILKSIRQHFPETLLSVDTFRAAVAKVAIQEGANIINDISAGNLDKNMLPLIAETKVTYIAMHMKGSPQTMQQHTQYQHVVEEIINYFLDKIEQLKTIGIYDIIIDPGIGFAKTLEQNYQIIAALEKFNIIQQPILIGISRKSMIYKILNTNPEHSLNGTTVLNTVALIKGANIIRVHDVKEAAECIKITKMIQ